MTMLWVALSGGLGCALRHGVGVASGRWLGQGMPWGTLIVNVVGSFAIGLAMAFFAARGEIDSRLRVAITSGFLGGFTTYSAFAFDSITFLERREPWLLAVYMGTMLVVAMLGCYLGLISGRSLAS